MKKRLLLCCLALLFGSWARAQEKVTLSGYVRGADDGEALIGAAVYVSELANGVVTNQYGFYSLSLPPGTYNLAFRYIGYVEQAKTVELRENLRLDIELATEETALAEVEIVSGREADENVASLEMSANKVEISTIQRMPALLGEVDVVRSIQLLPGVTTVGEGATGFNVRGGGIGQNLVLLDEAPVYNSSHLFGFFSVFNPDAVKDVKLVKGGIPAQYGGRLASILDVRMKEGNSKRFSAEGGVGLIFSRLTLSAPINKGKGSFIVAGRRSYADVLAKPFLNDDLKDSRFYFYDLTMKANYSLGEKDRIYLSSYFGRDVFDANGLFTSNWGNGTATFRWNHLFNDRLFSNLTAIYSNYDYQLGFGADNQDRFDWKSRIITYSLKNDFGYYLNTNNVISFGGQLTLYDFEPGTAKGISVGQTTDISLDNKYGMEAGLYAGNEQRLSDRLSLQYGLRWSWFNYMGPGTAYTYEDNGPNRRKTPVSEQEYDRWESIQTYGNLEPRFSMTYRLGGSASIKASYNRMVQYIHLISNTTASTPLDVWTPSTNNLRPEVADQVAVGFFKNLSGNLYETSVEVYYKDMQHHVDYIDGADLLLNRYLDGDLMQGRGRAFGAEFYVKKTRGRFNGWVSYTLARTERLVEGLNNGNWFPARFDQTHNLNVVMFYETGKRTSLSANFAFASGTPANFPANRFEWQGYAVPHNPANERNNLRIPAYHRLDLSLRLEGKKKEGKKKEDYWVFSVYNMYAKRNPFSIYFRQALERAQPGQPVKTEAIRVSIFGTIIPSVAYNFKF
jgi:hypothetical protein